MAYTRREYIRSVPQSKINRFTLGDTRVEFSHTALLKAVHSSTIGSGALEAARVTANKFIESYGRPYRLKVLTYPHEVVRAHKFMGFAGADRLSRGMSKSFGRPTSRMAKVAAGQTIIAIAINGDSVERAKAALKRASKKLPVVCKIVTEVSKLVETKEKTITPQQ